MTVVASKYAPKEHHLYETEEWVTHAVLRIFDSEIEGNTIWEPSAGNHKIADVLKSYGYEVITSDLVTHNREHDFLFDFLDGDGEVHREGYHDIFTNPPYGAGNRLAQKYVRNALKWCDGWIFMVLTAKFDFGSTRRDMFADCPRFYGKICLTDRVSWEGNGDGGTEDHAVYVWRPVDFDHNGEDPRPCIWYEGMTLTEKEERRKLRQSTSPG